MLERAKNHQGVPIPDEFELHALEVLMAGYEAELGMDLSGIFAAATLINPYIAGIVKADVSCAIRTLAPELTHRQQIYVDRGIKAGYQIMGGALIFLGFLRGEEAHITSHIDKMHQTGNLPVADGYEYARLKYLFEAAAEPIVSPAASIFEAAFENADSYFLAAGKLEALIEGMYHQPQQGCDEYKWGFNHGVRSAIDMFIFSAAKQQLETGESF